MKRHKRNTSKYKIIMKILLVFLILSSGYFFLFHDTNSIEGYNVDNLSIKHQFLTINPYSRSGDSLRKVKGIVVHYTANPQSSAKNNRNYFENLKNTHLTKASSHFIIGLEGEIIQCIPLNEISYASNHRNKDTISIECCHPNQSGRFTNETYNSLQTLIKSLMKTYNLDKNDVIRHYDITGKECPKYFVTHPQKWEEFKNSLED